MLQRKAKQRAVVVPKVDLTRFYHARTCVQMTKTEVEAILADPQRAPDSDDEEDVEDWKVVTHHLDVGNITSPHKSACLGGDLGG